MGMIGPVEVWCANCGHLSPQYERFCSAEACQAARMDELPPKGCPESDGRFADYDCADYAGFDHGEETYVSAAIERSERELVGRFEKLMARNNVASIMRIGEREYAAFGGELRGRGETVFDAIKTMRKP